MTSPADTAVWVGRIVEWHYPAVYICAFIFPAIRWARLKTIDKRIRLGGFVHQAATGFILPSFILLILSYWHPEFAKEMSPHEMGMAGLIALVTSLRELCVDGSDD